MKPTRFSRYLLPCLAVLTFVSVAWAQRPIKPAAGTTTLQDAIYAAEPGDILYAELYQPPLKQWIDIDRPLTIVGGRYAGTMTLHGPGQGTVTLIGATIWDTRTTLPTYSGYAMPAVTGGNGLEEVRLISCVIEATSPRFWDDYGHHAVALSVPRLTVVDSLILASAKNSNFPDYTCGSVMGPGPAAVDVWGTVNARGSTFQGGGGIRYCFDDFSGMCGDAPSYTDEGGPGVIAQQILSTGCTFLGGDGCSWKNRPEVGPIGPPFILR